MPDHDRRVIESPTLYRLATAEAWDPDAEEPYTVSTLGRSLAEEGFMHRSLARQVRGAVVSARAVPRRPDGTHDFSGPRPEPV